MSGWLYNPLTRTVNRVPTALEPYLLSGTTWHKLAIGYNATPEQAIAAAKEEFPNGVTFPEWGVTRDFQVHEVTNWFERRSIEALSFPNPVIWFESQNAAEDYAKKHESNLPWHHLPNPLDPLQAIGDFFHRLTEEQTWIRVGEAVAGGVLLFIGVKALAQGTPASTAAKTVTRPAKKTAVKVAKVAVPEARYATRVASRKVAPKATARVTAHRAKVAQNVRKSPNRQPPRG
jgi:hypothetical protein